MRKVALIPLLLGSTRIPDKNLILVDGYPLVFYVAKACKEAGIFDEIYIDSEHDVFGRMAEMLGVEFYQRKPQNGGSVCTMTSKSSQCAGVRCQTHDHFLYDFMSSTEPCLLALVHATSPLVTPETIRRFVETLQREGYDSLVSVEERSVETFFEGKPLNFDPTRKNPTQSLVPVQMITWALSGWRTESFTASYRADEADDSGPTFCGKTGVFPIDRVQALDADTWDDLYLIEAAQNQRRRRVQPGKFRFEDRVSGIEWDVGNLIERDGVSRYVIDHANASVRRLKDIIDEMGSPPWMYLVLKTGIHQVGLICQDRGGSNRRHLHTTHDEWWVILQGVYEWHLDDGTVITGHEGDLVFLPQGTSHYILCIEPGVRLACGANEMEHVYVD